MFENKLIFQVIGAVTVGSLVGTCSYWVFSSFSPKNNSFFLLTKSNTVNVADDANSDLYKNNAKNYYCELEDDKEKSDCDLMKEIKTPPNKTSFKNLITEKNEETIDKGTVKTADKYFFIKVNHNLGEKITQEPNKKIFIFSKGRQKLGELKFIAGKQNNKTFGKIKYFLTQATNVEEIKAVSNTNTKHLCSFDSSLREKLECEIYKFSNDSQNDESKYLDLNFVGDLSDSNKIKNNFKKNNYYIVELKEEKDISDTKIDNVFYFEETSADTTKKLSFFNVFPSIIYPENTKQNIFIFD